MRYTFTLVALMLVTFFIAGCSVKSSDSQYTYFQQGNVPTIAESNDGYYFTMGMYIYYMDKDNMAPVALCNQAACLHDKETNPRLVPNCQAFVGKNNGLFHCNDNIYVVTSTSSEFSDNNQLWEISLDGTSRKSICSFSGIVTGTTALHRGYLYYAYNSWDNEQNSIYGVNRINLNSIFPKDSVVYQGNTLGGTVNDIMAYEDNVYFVDFSHVINPPVERYYRYSLTGGETQLLYGLPEDVITSSPAIMNNKLHYRLNPLNPLATVDQKHCVAELDGTDSVDSFFINTNAQLHSGGMKQRILIAQSLLNDPQILVLDEPTAGVDPQERVSLRNFIRTISSSKIVLLSTHVVSDVESTADSIICLKKGKLIEHTSPSEMIKRYNRIVWTCDATQSQLADLQGRHLVSRITPGGDGYFSVRVIDNDAPIGLTGYSTIPTLEEIYLYLYKE